MHYDGSARTGSDTALPTIAPAPPTDGPPVKVINRAAPNETAASISSIPADIAEPTHLQI